MSKGKIKWSPKWLYPLLSGLVIVLALASFFVVQSLLNKPQIKTTAAKVPNTNLIQTPSATRAATLTTAKTATSAATIPQLGGKSISVPILYYHYIGNNPNPADLERNSLSISPQAFDDEMNYLVKNGYNTISLDTLYAALEGGQLPPKPIVITIDDGYEDLFYNGFPIILKYHVHVTSFIPTSLMNQGYYLSWAQIKQMQASGLFSFEAHSLTHPDLPSLSYDAQKEQIF